MAFVLDLTDKGRAMADRREPGGEVTTLLEARDAYQRGEDKRADALVLMVMARATETGDVDLHDQAVELARFFGGAA